MDPFCKWHRHRKSVQQYVFLLFPNRKKLELLLMVRLLLFVWPWRRCIVTVRAFQRLSSFVTPKQRFSLCILIHNLPPPTSLNAKIYQGDCMIFLNKLVIQQWIPGHCRVAGNELADYLPKQSISILQTSRNDILFNNIKLLIKKKTIKNFVLN